jgi:serine/threonine protein kinase
MLDVRQQRKKNDVAVLQSEMKWIWEFILDLMETVAVINGNGVIHRDIKPENIVLFMEEFRYTLLDFGLSRVLPTLNNSDKTLTCCDNSDRNAS